MTPSVYQASFFHIESKLLEAISSPMPVSRPTPIPMAIGMLLGFLGRFRIRGSRPGSISVLLFMMPPLWWKTIGPSWAERIAHASSLVFLAVILGIIFIVLWVFVNFIPVSVVVPIIVLVMFVVMTIVLVTLGLVLFWRSVMPAVTWGTPTPRSTPTAAPTWTVVRSENNKLLFFVCGHFFFLGGGCY